MKINILGTEYDFIISTEKDDTRLENSDGYHDGYAKIIKIESDYNKNHSHSIQNYDEFHKTVKRHEIIHSFFFQSGLNDYCGNEQLVDWISAQFPKMLKVFEQIEAS